jgi:multimeric flavodoxin WrbA
MQLDAHSSHFEILTGSERVDGNTEQIAEQVRLLLQTHGCTAGIIFLRTDNIKPCGSCGECNTRTTQCGIDDDMPALIERMKAADGLIYITPVHGYGMAHPMQIFIERAGVGYLRFTRPLANKVAGAIVTGRRYGHVAVHNQLINNMLLNRMILVGSGYPAILFGGSPGKAMEDQEGLESVRSLVTRMVNMAKLLRLVPPEAASLLLASDTLNERISADIKRADICSR